MPFVPSTDESFEPTVPANRSNIDTDAQDATWRTGVRDAFDAYQERSDIESRASILARRDAEPGSIFWEAQPDGHEVTVITEPSPEEPEE